MGSPFTVQTTTGRVILVAAVAVTTLGFALWFLSKGPFVDQRSARVPPRGVTKDPEGPAPPRPPPGKFRYPDLQSGGQLPLGMDRDFDPFSRGAKGRVALPKDALELLARLPAQDSTIGLADLHAIRKLTWAREILSGKRLPPVRRRLDLLGVDPAGVERAAFTVDLEQRAPRAPSGTDLRFMGRYDRPFYLVAESPARRSALLHRFRSRGPLTASMLMGRRVYRRDGDYSVSLPVRGVVVWSYRKPMGALLRSVVYPPGPKKAHAQRRDALRQLLTRAGVDLAKPPDLVVLWRPQPKRRTPWPLGNLRGVGLSGVVATVSFEERRILGQLTIATADAKSAGRAAKQLRQLRRRIAARGSIVRALLAPLVHGVSVTTKAKRCQVTLELRPWHVRAILGLLGQLLSD